MNAKMDAEFEESGFLLIERVVPAELLEPLRAEADRLLGGSDHRAGVRNALSLSQMLAELGSDGQPAEFARHLLGPDARPTKLTVFDKTAQANWKVPWHQDLTITVRERLEVAGFGPWSVKDGATNVQPPASILKQIVAIRIHLDDTSITNGALRVLPGTHKLGRLSDGQVAELLLRVPESVCAVRAGGSMLMRPLLLHASSVSEPSQRRRVLHFEYSAEPLPGGLAWE